MSLLHHYKNNNAFAVLCNVPVLLLVTVASLDYADKQLLASSFPVLERTLHLDIQTLGYFSLFADLSYALSVPYWGYLVHKHGIQRVFFLLAIACACWGVATIGIAVLGSSITGQAIMRSLNGFMLGSILPLSQTLLVEMVPPIMRGRGFGIMAVAEKLAGTFATTSVVYCDGNWQIPYYCLGLMSLFMSCLVYRYLDPSRRPYPMMIQQQQYTNSSPQELEEGGDEKQVKLTMRRIVQRIAQLPAFRCLVAQGVFGGIPWSMMSFQLLLLDWRGFNKEEIVTIQFTSGLAGTLGGWIGGSLGDYAAYRLESRSSSPIHGRIIIALISVIGGIPAYGMFLYSTTYTTSLAFVNVFHVLASWTQTAAIRPICVDLTRNPSERAQIVAMWTVLEKASAAIFGAPLVGYMTSHILHAKQEDTVGSMIVTVGNDERAWVLARQLFILSTFFWVLCAFFWILIAQYTNNIPSLSVDKRYGSSNLKELEMEDLLSKKENRVHK
eukprot:CAMPEP_0204624460 /NCGR_PEP_ID=MMETSP0717-20131115/10204_1 /ASSEMBLY_ACC=CAM_ASM_000666 /TAXON_ID=230516 /ORGANISM="Chaetoceros curvisetus" /LENGTH=496 /DNA_ID=CAMNT_0051639855 /DNA_START=95 /DNA_END=1585 /DNA_ORIENTATION=+